MYLFILLFHDRGVAQHLLQRADAQLAVDVAVVVTQRGLPDSLDPGNLLRIFPIYIQIENLPFCRSKTFKACEKHLVLIRIDLVFTVEGKTAQFPAVREILLFEERKQVVDFLYLRITFLSCLVIRDAAEQRLCKSLTHEETEKNGNTEKKQHKENIPQQIPDAACPEFLLRNETIELHSFPGQRMPETPLEPDEGCILI